MSRILRTSLRAASVLAVSVAVAVGCDAAGTTPGTSGGPAVPELPGVPTTAPVQPTTPLVAYRTTGEIGVVDGTKVIASTPGAFIPSGGPLITEDGKFAFARAADATVALEVATTATQTVPVPRDSRIGTAGGSVLVWWEQPNRLMQFDLANPAAGPTVRRQVDLPPNASAGDARLITARAGTAVIARVESTPSPFGGPDTLYAVRGDAEPSSLDQVDANTPVEVAALSPDGAQLAYGLYRRSGTACGTAAVVVSAADGTQQSFDVAAPDPATGSRVQQLWWDDSRPMALSLATWRCDSESYYSPRVWEFRDDSLAQTQPPTVALQAIDVTPGQRALIIPQGGQEPQESGTLVVEDSGRRFPVKPDVDTIDVIEPAQE